MRQDAFKHAKVMFAAIAAALALPLADRMAALGKIPGYVSRGKGGKKHPRHSSARFVAQDKRDARKARNYA